MPNEPKLITVYREADNLLRQYGLKDDGWRFEFSNHKRFVGMCYYSRKLIVYSKHFLSEDDEVITDTLLHEIAHALTPGAGHGTEWKTKCVEIGANPHRIIEEVKNPPKHNYIVQCPKCNATWRRYRIKRAIRTATHCGVPVVVYRVKHDN